MKWVTLHRPQLDHIACAWLIRRFIDPAAEISFVNYEELPAAMAEDGVITIDIQGSAYTLLRSDKESLFDIFISKHQLADPALLEVADVVRCAITGRFHLSPQAAGFRAVASGIAQHAGNEQQFLQQASVVLDALYTWASHLRKPVHKNSADRFMEVFHRFITQKYADRAQKPIWVKEIAAIVQDGIDTNLNLGLATLAQKLEANSGSIAPDPDEHLFGEAMRRIRMEKAMELMEEDRYTLAEIAYLTGFSDQGHFSRIFGKYYGKTPTGHLKTIRAQKDNEDEE